MDNISSSFVGCRSGLDQMRMKGVGSNETVEDVAVRMNGRVQASGRCGDLSGEVLEEVRVLIEVCRGLRTTDSIIDSTEYGWMRSNDRRSLRIQMSTEQGKGHRQKNRGGLAVNRVHCLCRNFR